LYKSRRLAFILTDNVASLLTLASDFVWLLSSAQFSEMDDSNIPIDIHAHKLLDWLISRRHVNKDWLNKLTDIRNKVRSALQDMPEHEGIGRLLSSGDQLNYFTCKQLFEILKQTESDSKNFFGYYSSQRMKDWQEIISDYEKGNVYLAEAAQVIHRNVSFEIPSLKKQLSKMDATYHDLERQESETIKKSQRLLSEKAKDMESLGISKDENPASQITQKLDLLPGKLKKIESSLAKLNDVNDYYRGFVKATQGKDKETCPLLRYIISKGNTTYFEYARGFKPEQVVAEKSATPESTNQEDVIDFGDEDGNTIDFGDTEVSSSTSNGNGSSTSDGFVHVNDSDVESSRKASVDEIDFGDDAPLDVSIETAVDPSDRIACGKDALTILENRKTRDLLFHELYELEGFFSQRIFETSSSQDFNFLEVTMSSILSSFQEQNLSDYLTIIQDILKLLSEEILKLLLQIKENPQSIDNLVKKLKLKEDLLKKCHVKAEELREKQKEVIVEKQKMAQQLPSLISSTRKLEARLEEAISSKYKNRPVNIMAGAQTL
jgi:hypothetical protein